MKYKWIIMFMVLIFILGCGRNPIEECNLITFNLNVDSKEWWKNVKPHCYDAAADDYCKLRGYKLFKSYSCKTSSFNDREYIDKITCWKP